MFADSELLDSAEFKTIRRNNREVEAVRRGLFSSAKIFGYIKGILAAAGYKSFKYNTYGCLGALPPPPIQSHSCRSS